jgi:two-component system, OmpR family, response regulator MprA
MPSHVLIVDDEPAIRSAIRIILHLEGFTTADAADGRRALEQVAEDRPAVVLLDLQMPVMDGGECCRQLRVIAPDLPIVMMTAKDRAQAVAQAHDAAGCLPKPFDVDGLLDTVARFIPNPGP